MLKKLALSGVFSLCIASVSQAATLSGTFSGTVDSPYGATGPIIYDGAGTNSLAWGTENDSKRSFSKKAASSLTVNNGSFSESIMSAGKVLLGTITWVNHSNWYTGKEWDSNVNLSLDIDSPSASGPHDQSVAFSIVNTTDQSYNAGKNNQTGLNPDVISGMQVVAGAFGTPILLGDGLKLTGVFFDLLKGGSPGTIVDFDGFGSTFDPNNGSWVNREGGYTTIAVYGNVSAVPLPAGVWLLLGGIGGLAALRRRRGKEAA